MQAQEHTKVSEEHAAWLVYADKYTKVYNQALAQYHANHRDYTGDAATKFKMANEYATEIASNDSDVDE
jgi:hypothetical protein